MGYNRRKQQREFKKKVEQGKKGYERNFADIHDYQDIKSVKFIETKFSKIFKLIFELTIVIIITLIGIYIAFQNLGIEIQDISSLL